jgi:hypothetical protein
VTTELALTLPVIALLVGVVLTAGGVAVGQVRCVDAARAGARAAARAEPVDVVEDTVRRVGPSDLRLDIRESAGEVVVEVSAPVELLLPGRPTLTVRSRAVARRERP